MKNKLISLVIVFIIFTILGTINSEQILTGLISMMPKGVTLIALNPFEVFNTIVSISIFIGLLATLPLLIYYLISYINPALYEHEKHFIQTNLLIGLFLFLFGTILSFIIYIKFGLTWFAQFNLSYGFETLWSLSLIMGSLFSLSLISGIAFEFPLLIYQLKVNKLISLNLNTKSRLIFLMILFTMIGIITPDGSFITQILLSVPIYLLLEGSLYLADKKIKMEEQKWHSD